MVLSVLKFRKKWVLGGHQKRLNSRQYFCRFIITYVTIWPWLLQISVHLTQLIELVPLPSPIYLSISPSELLKQPYKQKHYLCCQCHWPRHCRMKMTIMEIVSPVCPSSSYHSHAGKHDATRKVFRSFSFIRDVVGQLQASLSEVMLKFPYFPRQHGIFHFHVHICFTASAGTNLYC